MLQRVSMSSHLQALKWQVRDVQTLECTSTVESALSASHKAVVAGLIQSHCYLRLSEYYAKVDLMTPDHAPQCFKWVFVFAGVN
jgi:hypothetical protein